MTIEEQQNYQKAQTYMMQNIHQPVTHDLIKSIHAHVVPNIKREYRTGGNAPKIQNHKTKETRYLPPMGMFCAEYMQDFLNWYDQDLLSIEMILARFHWGFVKIHPFEDGNGRTACLLMSFILLNHGFNNPFCEIFEKHFESNRTSYIDALNDGKMTYSSFKNVSQIWENYIRNAFEETQKNGI